jgi:very-short-patch-repair endonuclease
LYFKHFGNSLYCNIIWVVRGIFMASVAQQLDTNRRALLDLSTRNRLLSTPRQKKTAKTIELVDEYAVEVFRLLVKEGKALSFLPGREKSKTTTGDSAELKKDDDFGELPQPEDDGVDERGMGKRHTDQRLQTLLTSEGLQKRLLTLYYDAQTFEEEQGVNILYLAIGMLKWFEDDNSEKERYAPLILVPVSLERGTATERFKLRWREEDIAANLSLQAKMKAEFGLIIPDLPQDDDLDVTAYMRAVQQVVSAQKRFVVNENDIVLGFFSFAKFLMYRDLDPANWPENGKIDADPLIAGLLRDGFPAAEGMIGEDENVDTHLTPAQMAHVVDADGSQALAIEEVRRGRNLVIQGPPGTGKSQTITNIIASAVADGKKVLFVAEKMAALEVVHRRMSNIGLGPICFELHSHKSNKRAVLDELRQTRDLGRPRSDDNQQATAKLLGLRDALNKHAQVLHATLAPCGMTPFQVIGHSVRLKQDEVEARGVVLHKPEFWSAEDKRDRESILADVVARIGEIGAPVQHPWRGVCRNSLLPNEYDSLCNNLAELRELLARIVDDVRTVERSFPNTSPALISLQMVDAITKVVIDLNDANYQAIAHPLWQNGVPLLNELVQSGMKHTELKAKLSTAVADAAWNTDFTQCRQQLAMHGESMLRFMKSSYREAVALLKSCLTCPLPKSHAERLALVDDIIQVQKIEKLLGEQHEAGLNGFGELWQGVRSDWQPMMSLLTWRNALPVDKLPKDFLVHCAKITTPSEWRDLATRIGKEVPAFFAKAVALMDSLQLDMQLAFGVENVLDIDREAFAARLEQWILTTETLSKWIAFKGRYDLLCSKGVQSIAEKLWNNELPREKAQGTFERAYFDVLTEMVFALHPQLREFDGDQHNNLVLNFRETDKYRIEQNRIEIRSKHYNGLPKSEGGIGPLGILNREFSRRRNHMPIRQLIKHAGPAIQALKPVFMMSPLSVAQFLEPGALQFDLLVIDEASQVEPVDALGAIARAKQIVVVGDTRQLPPTRFFSRMTADLDDEESDSDEPQFSTSDVESILSLCLGNGLPQRMLRWHYRSKHQSLIAVSNKQFYENKLFIVPSPYDAASGMGLKFNHLPHAVFESGGSGTNPIEAKAVAEAVIRHAKEHPNLSLGVGAFSVKQRQAILDEIELLRRTHPETEPFFAAANQDEPFFVKNLENIQGDERDVIFISIGYGRKQDGSYTASFGPLNSEGGERRLNVLISRAKRRCEVFSSITADNIDLERAKGAGVAALKLFLKFAETGKLDFGQTTDREPDSIFEEQVAGALRARGYDVKTQIGLAGFFIDLAVVDKSMPGRFVLGIECDGAAYHSSRSARDRDRLRQAVLEDHGWIIHRIWSTDWFRRPKEQLEKTIAAIEQAKTTLAEREQKPEAPVARPVFEIISHDDGDVVNLHAHIGEKNLSIPYQEAILSVPTHIEPHDVADNDMADIVAKIVEMESPIHENEVIMRIRTLWNLGRAGSRIQAKVKAGLSQAVRRGMIACEGEFYLEQGADVHVRDRSTASSAGLKKPEHLPPQEIRKAILALIEANFGASYSQLPTEVARLLGFKATSAQLREVIEPQIQELLNNGKLQETGNQLTLRDASKMA